MPRKKQVVQKRKRQKVYNPGAMSGDATHLKRTGIFRLFSNYRLFAIIGAIAIIGGLAFSALLGSGGPGSSQNDTSVRGEGVQRDETPVPDETSVTGAAANIKRYPSAPAFTIDPGRAYTATIKTSKGDIRVELLASQAPETVNNFVFLAQDKFYDGVTFHRVIPGFVAQSGDPTGTGSDGPGYDLVFEKTDAPFDAGVLAMANRRVAGSLNNGSQFFFTLEAQPSLEATHTAFGRVADEQSLEVLRSLTARDPDRNPGLPPGDRIESITIEDAEAPSAAAQ
jgi:cyclophilin family peptidyl-prolyl cis-trans isomerase